MWLGGVMVGCGGTRGRSSFVQARVRRCMAPRGATPALHSPSLRARWIRCPRQALQACSHQASVASSASTAPLAHPPPASRPSPIAQSPGRPHLVHRRSLIIAALALLTPSPVSPQTPSLCFACLRKRRAARGNTALTLRYPKRECSITHPGARLLALQTSHAIAACSRCPIATLRSVIDRPIADFQSSLPHTLRMLPSLRIP